jgi:hypothetical protein
MAGTWEVPPVSVHGKSYKAADFVGWMLTAPVVSERARDALSDLCGRLVEFLPFHAIRGEPYFALNVLSQDERQPINKAHGKGVVRADERFGEVVRDNALSGVALADPSRDIGRRVVRGESLHDFPGLVG